MSALVSSEEERLARAVLSRLSEPADRQLVPLVDQHGAVEVWARIRDGSLPAGNLKHYRARLADVDPGRDFAAAQRCGARFVCPGEGEWPTQLDDLGAARPLGLWVRGEADLRWWALRSVAVVGARACTSYGEYVAGAMADGLAARGWTVVSGAA